MVCVGRGLWLARALAWPSVRVHFLVSSLLGCQLDLCFNMSVKDQMDVL